MKRAYILALIEVLMMGCMLGMVAWAVGSALAGIV